MSSSPSVAELAYRLWNERGRPEGTHEQDWLEAERLLSAEGRRSDNASQDPIAVNPTPTSAVGKSNSADGSIVKPAKKAKSVASRSRDDFDQDTPE